MREVRYSLGIDPGWRNLGIALVKEESGSIELVKSGTVNPSSLPSKDRAVLVVKDYLALTSLHSLVDFFQMERYVSYQNVNTAEAENILMLMGELKNQVGTWFLKEDSDTILLRAIDWKTEMVKTLVKTKGFDNPSTSLDKKFSIAAAHACLDKPGTFNTDHEADAICLACLPFLRERAKPEPKQPT